MCECVCGPSMSVYVWGCRRHHQYDWTMYLPAAFSTMKDERSSCLLCFGHHPHFRLPDLSRPTLQAQPICQTRQGWLKRRADWQPDHCRLAVVPCLLSVTVSHWKCFLKGLQRVSCTWFSLSGDGSARRRLVETLSHKGKAVIFFPYLLQHYLFLLLSSLFPLFTVHTNIMEEFVFLEARCLKRILIKHSQDAASTNAPFFIFTYSHTHTPTHFLEKACKHTTALVYCHCVRERQGGVGGHDYTVHNKAESEN